MKRGGSLSFLVGTISNVLVMEIGWTDVGSGGYILVSCTHSNTSFVCAEYFFNCPFSLRNTRGFFSSFFFFWFKILCTKIVSNKDLLMSDSVIKFLVINHFRGRTFD